MGRSPVLTWAKVPAAGQLMLSGLITVLDLIFIQMSIGPVYTLCGHHAAQAYGEGWHLPVLLRASIWSRLLASCTAPGTALLWTLWDFYGLKM